MGANGWVRVAATRNVKRRYSPNFPFVQIEAVHACSAVTPAKLRDLGLVAPDTICPVFPGGNGRRPKAAPDYRRCLDKAPTKPTGERDRSLADFTFGCTCIRWGWSIDETAGLLMQEPSSKAAERGYPYALQTAKKAAAVVRGS